VQFILKIKYQKKRCGHRPNKQIVSTDEMVDRLKTCIFTRDQNDPSFVIMARTDSFEKEGMDGLLKRCDAYITKGKADMLFPEALTELSQYEKLNKTFGNQIPILANITEFGKTPLFTVNQLKSVGVSMILYPLSAHRAMSKAALTVYEKIIKEGTQANCLHLMQTRDDLYKTLDYYEIEKNVR